MSGRPDLTGKTLDGRYRLVRKLREGGMGEVYEGIDTKLDRRVAIKTLHPRLSYESRFRERFLLEAKSASKIGHPNVVHIMDFGETPDDSVYFVMEFLEGRDLRALLAEQGRLPWPRVRELLLQIIDGLAAAHDKGIIHRDIKPGNCFLVSSGPPGGTEQVKLLDFGIAKIGSDVDREALTATGEVYGTAAYMAPEQARGESLDARSDIYSLGAMVYEMLTGEVPFVGGTAVHVITRHLTDAPEPPRKRVPSIPTPVEALVLITLAKDIRDRFGSMAELREAIEQIPADTRAATSGLQKTSQLDALPDHEVERYIARKSSGSLRRTLEVTSAPSRGRAHRSPADDFAPSPGTHTTEVSGPRPAEVASAPSYRRVHRSSADDFAPSSGTHTTEVSGPRSTSITRSHRAARRPSVSLGQRIALVIAVFVVVAGLTATATVAVLGDAAAGTAIESSLAEPTSVEGAGEPVAVEDGSRRASDAPDQPALPTEPGAEEAALPVPRAEPMAESGSTSTGALAEDDPSTGESPAETGAPESTEPDDQSPPVESSPEPVASEPSPPTTLDHRAAECVERRKKAETAMDRRQWRKVLSATSVSSCWAPGKRSSRRGMRVMAYLQLREFAKCAKAGRGLTDPKIKNAVAICERQKSRE